MHPTPASSKRPKFTHTDSKYFPEATPIMLAENSPSNSPLTADGQSQTHVVGGNQVATLPRYEGLTGGAITGLLSPNVETPQFSKKKRKRAQAELHSGAVPYGMKVESRLGIQDF